jgi:hypothetical protein
MEFYLGFFNFCGVLAVLALPIVAVVNVCRYGKLNVTSREYRGLLETSQL